MSDIQPALTAEEWAKARSDEGVWVHHVIHDATDPVDRVSHDGHFGIRGAYVDNVDGEGEVDDYTVHVPASLELGCGDLPYASGPMLPALIALANAALPDDDPRKLKAEHRDALRQLLSGRYDSFSLMLQRMESLAAAIHALLPPTE
jgi:hypothetical protein